jgi:hypothetical protein
VLTRKLNSDQGVHLGRVFGAIHYGLTLALSETCFQNTASLTEQVGLYSLLCQRMSGSASAVHTRSRGGCGSQLGVQSCGWVPCEASIVLSLGHHLW